jgi:menaquinol-cytochrome c reductase iron-sulfur subunit
MDRRKLLTILVHTGGMLVAGIVAIPALLMGISPAIQPRRGPTWSPLGPLDDFPAGEMTQAAVEVPRDDWAQSLWEKGVYVWRPADDDDGVVVFSRNCTDLSCPVTFDTGSQWFYCPCHGGIFAKDGTPRAGPPKRPLFRYANRVRDGVLEIDLASLPPVT